MKTKLLLWVVLFLAVLPFVFSFDCSLIEETSYCEEIQFATLAPADKSEIYSSLLYPENSIINYDLIRSYNKDIVMDTPPEGLVKYSTSYIKNAWLSFSSVFPSVYEEDILYVPTTTQVLSHYDYDVKIPSNYYASSYPKQSNGDCKRKNYLKSNTAQVKYYLNNVYKGEGDQTLIYVDDSGELKANLNIKVKVRTKHYEWEDYWYWHTCKYSHTTYSTSSLGISEDKNIVLYDIEPNVNIETVNNYGGTTKINFSAENYNRLEINFAESSYSEQLQTYHAVFEKDPFDIAYLRVSNASLKQQKNLYLSGGSLYVNNIDDCTIKASNHFSSIEQSCELVPQEQEVPSLEIEKKDLDLSVLYVIGMFLLLVYLIYKILKSQFKKIVIPILLLLLLIPTVVADTGEEECGITNIASCLPNAIYNFILGVINAPLAPLLITVQNLLTSDVSTSAFYHIWSIIRYMISFFYIFLILYSGYIFLTANADPIRRANAKELLKNLVIIMVLVQGSYYIYDLLINISSNMSASIISFVDPHFFLLTADNITNIGLEFLFSFSYALTLFATVILLVFRYIMVAIGVIFFPIGIFCYFIPPLKSYGRFIVNLFMIMIFITFFDLLIILVCSQVVDISLFENMKILVMITCFGIVNYTLWLTMKFAIKRSTAGSLKDDLNQAVKYIALLA